MSQNEYKDLILTNHALHRMRQRGVSHDQVWQAYKYPDATGKAQNGGTQHKKVFGQYEVTIIFKLNQQHWPVVISVWMDPPMPGSEDFKRKQQWKEYKKAGFGKKIWLTLLRQMGL